MPLSSSRPLAALTAGALTAAGLVALSSPASAAGTTELFSSTAPGFRPDAATVPADICFVTISATGGDGGNGTHQEAVGGVGAAVTARVPVEPGAKLSMMVGGAGQNGRSNIGGAGGVGGGGGGGAHTNYPSTGPAGGGGGGASVVSTGSTPLVVAGGGGGAFYVFRGGGIGGLGTNGVAGNGGNGISPTATAGFGGSSTGDGGGVDSAADGAGGGGGVRSGASGRGAGAAGGGGANGVGGGGGGGGVRASFNGSIVGQDGFAGTNGGTGTGAGGKSGGAYYSTSWGGDGDTTGGNGGAFGSHQIPGYAVNVPGAGGGGGIGYGGGGGGSAEGAGGGGGGYGAGGGGRQGGGGGGSSFVTPRATGTPTFARSSATTDGQITISYDAAADACNAPTLTSVAITPQNPDLEAGSTQQLTATGGYDDDSAADLSEKVTWSSSKTSVATVSASGLVSATSEGTTTIRATLDGVSTSTDLTVSPARTIPTLSGDPSVTGTVGTPLEHVFSMSGYPAPGLHVVVGDVPAGLEINSQTGVLSGTPTLGGTSTLRLKAYNSKGFSDDLEVTFTINDGARISGDATASGTRNSAFSYEPKLGGFPEPAVTLTDGQLPDGLELDSATGAITGKPTQTGTFPITLSAENGVGDDATLDLTLTIEETAGLTGDAEANGALGSDFTYSPALIGYPTALVTVASGALPEGLELSPITGQISGTPTESGEFSVTLEADNGVGDPARLKIAITIHDPATLTGDDSARGMTGAPFSFAPLVTGFPAPQVTLTAGELPDGLTLDAATGGISGIPEESGTFLLTLSAANATGDDQLDVTVTIDAAATLIGEATATGVTGSPFAYAPAATGQPTPTVTVASGSLPEGLALDADTGQIAGRPTQSGTFPITLKADNGVGGAATLDVTITVTEGVISGLAPRITGTAREGRSLTAEAGDVGPESARLTYQWRANGSAIAGATGRTLMLTKAQAGRRITVSVTATAPGVPAATKTSAATAVVSSPHARLVLSTSKVTGRQKLTVTATGLKPRQQAIIWLAGKKAYAGRADANGVVQRHVAFASSISDGKRRVRVSGYVGSRRTFTTVATVTYKRR